MLQKLFVSENEENTLFRLMVRIFNDVLTDFIQRSFEFYFLKKKKTRASCTRHKLLKKYILIKVR